MSTVKSITKKYENHSNIININNKEGKSENRYEIPSLQQNKSTELLKT